MSLKGRVTAWMALVVTVIGLRIAVEAQKEGNNAIYSGSGNAASTAYIDAGAFYNNGNSGLDICTILNKILTCSSSGGCGGYSQYPAAGAVIDARGILPLQGAPASLSCSGDPFYNSTTSSYVTVPSTILLPGETIMIPQPWVLPSNTRIIGVGSGLNFYTTIGAQSSFAIPSSPQSTIPTMIQMGVGSISSPTLATGVVIENLIVYGNGLGFFDGIDNLSAGDGSYVNDVDITGIGPLTSTSTLSGTACTPNSGAITGLCIGKSATYSGPYTNFNIAPSNACSSGTMCQHTACAKIQAQTHGLHNVTCVGSSNSSNFPAAAIYLDSYGTSVENVHVEGFYDAVVVGDYADNQGGLNVNGATTPTVGGNTIATVTGSASTGAQLTNTVHICKGGTLSAGSACSTNNVQIRDLVITQALSNSNTTSTVAAIQDDIAGWTGGVNSSGPQGFVGLYAIGNLNTGSTGGYARFTTAPAGSTFTGTTLPSPTWGSGAPSSLGACTTSGAIFSATNGISNQNTIFVCSKFSSGTLTWKPIGN
jgi:hypothetical protein